MSAATVDFTVFTKPWKMPVPELAAFVAGMGFDGIELPVRPGFQVEPENADRDLPVAAKQLAEFGVRIDDIASVPDEKTIAGCAEAGIPLIRICVSISNDEDYLSAETRLLKEYEALVPLLDRYGVKVGLQNHCGRFVGSAIGTRRLLEPFDPKHFGAVWDPAHCALAGEPPELAVDILWPHLCLVNLKNAFWVRTNGPEAECVHWKYHWTSGRQGLASWPAVAELLKERGYAGAVCLCAEFSDHDAVDRLTVEDLEFARVLFSE